MTRARIVVIVFLATAAWWAALPWIDCARVMYPFGGGVYACTVGIQAAYGIPDPSQEPGGMPHWGFWPNLAAAITYLAAAVVIARRREPI